MKQQELEQIISQKYEPGFFTDVDEKKLAPGLNEEVIAFISSQKDEPRWLLNWRLKAYHKWQKMEDPVNGSKPKWANVNYNPINYQAISYYAAPKKKFRRLEEVDPEILNAYNKLGIPLLEQKLLSGIAVDAVFDSVSIGTTFQKQLFEFGIIFCSFSEAVEKHPELIKKYLGTVVPIGDNFFATLNSAVFSDGSFCYIPQEVECPMPLSTYFRINAANVGQFERTLIIADKNSKVNYLEGCTAPIRDENQLHAAVVELISHENAEINYSTVQNWYPGNEKGEGGVFNFVTKRGLCEGKNSKISWNQVETGSAITWKYPSCILLGDNSIGEFHSVAFTSKYQQADTGTKMIHIGKNTKSNIVSKGISAGHGKNTYRGLVEIGSDAENSRNHTNCDSLLIGSNCSAITVPCIKNKNSSSRIEHEARISKIDGEVLFYCQQRGINAEKAISLIVNGMCQDVFSKLPLEFAAEAQKLLEISLEGSVG